MVVVGLAPIPVAGAPPTASPSSRAGTTASRETEARRVKARPSRRRSPHGFWVEARARGRRAVAPARASPPDGHADSARPWLVLDRQAAQPAGGNLPLGHAAPAARSRPRGWRRRRRPGTPPRHRARRAAPGAWRWRRRRWPVPSRLAGRSRRRPVPTRGAFSARCRVAPRSSPGRGEWWPIPGRCAVARLRRTSSSTHRLRALPPRHAARPSPWDRQVRFRVVHCWRHHDEAQRDAARLTNLPTGKVALPRTMTRHWPMQAGAPHAPVRPRRTRTGPRVQGGRACSSRGAS